MRTGVLRGGLALALFTAILSIAPSAAAEPEPVLHWAFETGSGTRVPEVVSGEASVAAMHGTIDWIDGLAPYSFYALGFGDNPASYIDAGTLTVDEGYIAGSHPDFRVLRGTYTITAWIQFGATTSSEDRTILSSDWDASDGWLLFIHSQDGQVNDLGFDFGSDRAYAGLDLPPDTPLFVVLQADVSAASLGDGKHRFSVWDGAIWQSETGETFSPIRLQGLEIGTFSDGERSFGGTIDDVRIYDTVLSQEDLNRLSGAAASGNTNSP
ncbi:LamG-like jellyroll fold domain-containing protein [Candidatus Bipolaricaulota bacterium]